MFFFLFVCFKWHILFYLFLHFRKKFIYIVQQDVSISKIQWYLLGRHFVEQFYICCICACNGCVFLSCQLLLCLRSTEVIRPYPKPSANDFLPFETGKRDHHYSYVTIVHMQPLIRRYSIHASKIRIAAANFFV